MARVARAIAFAGGRECGDPPPADRLQPERYEQRHRLVVRLHSLRSEAQGHASAQRHPDHRRAQNVPACGWPGHFGGLGEIYRRDTYLAALDEASMESNIQLFSAFIAERVQRADQEAGKNS